MGDHANRVDRGILRPNPALVQEVAELDIVHAAGTAIEDDDVRFYACGIDFQTRNFRDAFGKKPRIRMIFVQASRGMFKSQQARGGNDANLAHSTAEHFAIDAGALDKFAGTENHRANGSPEAFGEAEHYGVNFLSHVGDAIAERSRPFEDALSIQAPLQPPSMPTVATFF